MLRFRRLFAFAPVALALTLASATSCSGLLAPTFVPTNEQYSTVVLAPGGSNMATFTLSSPMFAGVGLVTVTSNATGQILSPTMTLVLGTPSGATTCQPTSTKTVTPSLVSQIQQPLAAGTYCASVTDTSLTEPGVTTLRINTSVAAPANISTPTAVDVFSSTLGPTGSATHQLNVGFNGITNLAFVSAGTAGPVGITFGVWDGQACRPSSTVTTPATGATIIVVTTDPGNYCIRVFDVGGLTAPILFTIDTTYP